MGPASSGPTSLTAALSHWTATSIIGYSATADLLSDDKKYPRFVRLPPADALQAQVQYTLIKGRGWKCVNVIAVDVVFSLGGRVELHR